MNGPEEATTLCANPSLHRASDGRVWTDQIIPVRVFAMLLKEPDLTWPAVGLSQLSPTTTTSSTLINCHFTAFISAPQNTLISAGIDFSKDESHNVMMWPQATESSQRRTSQNTCLFILCPERSCWKPSSPSDFAFNLEGCYCYLKLKLLSPKHTSLFTHSQGSVYRVRDANVIIRRVHAYCTCTARFL